MGGGSMGGRGRYSGGEADGWWLEQQQQKKKKEKNRNEDETGRKGPKQIGKKK